MASEQKPKTIKDILSIKALIQKGIAESGMPSTAIEVVLPPSPEAKAPLKGPMAPKPIRPTSLREQLKR